MSQPEQNSDIERRLSELGDRLAAIEPVADEVRRRVAATAIEPSQMRRWMAASAISIIAIVMIGWWAHRLSPPRQSHEVVTATANSSPSLEIDGISIHVRFAGVINSRSTLVCWTCSGAIPITQVPAEKELRHAIRRGSYAEIPVRTDVAPGGEMICWSLFIADPGEVLPGELPTVRVQVADSQVGFGVWPVNYSSEMLPGAISSASLTSTTAVQLSEIHQVIERFEQNGSVSN